MNRIPNLISIYTCFQKTGIHLMAMGEHGYRSPTASDDMGYFLYVTLMSHIFSLPVLSAAYLFFYTNVVLIVGSIALSFSMLAEGFLAYSIVIIGSIRMLMPLLYLSHVYVAYAAVFCVIPFLLFCDHKKFKKALLAGFFCGGALLSVLDNTRMYASLPVLVFLLIYLFGTTRWSKRVKYHAILLFLLGYLIPVVHFNTIIQKRNAFLSAQGGALPDKTKHLFWHNIYMGLGFLNNKENIAWSDSCAAQKALEIDSEARYPSKRYEKTIKEEVFRLCKERRYFVAQTIFAKLGVLLYFFLIYFGGIGLAVSWFFPKPWYIEFAFWSALAVSALPGILTLPVVAYVLGFITCTIIYTIYSCIWAILQREKSNAAR